MQSHITVKETDGFRDGDKSRVVGKAEHRHRSRGCRGEQGQIMRALTLRSSERDG